MKLKVRIIGNYEPDRQHSMLAFVRVLEEGLRNSSVNVEVVRPPVKVGGLGKGKFEKYFRYFDKYIYFPSLLKRLSTKSPVDFTHISDQSNSVYGPNVTGRWGVTVHDVLPLRAHRGDFDWWTISGSGQKLQAWIKQSLFQAHSYATVTAGTKQDLLNLGAPTATAQAATVIWNCVYSVFDDMGQAEALRKLEAHGHGGLAPYFFHIGGNQPYKNRPAAITIFAELAKFPEFQQHRLVMAGAAFTPAMEEALNKTGIRDKVVYLPTPSTPVVNCLYAGADALLWPSHAEGFGLPIIEAFMTSTPVFSSNGNPMPEVGGDAAAYFDPSSPVAAAASIRESWPTRQERVTLGKERLPLFNQETMFRAYEDWYKQQR